MCLPGITWSSSISWILGLALFITLTTHPVQLPVCIQITGTSATAASSIWVNPGTCISDTTPREVAESFKKSRLESDDCLDIFFSSIY
jgi:hypothetical protein